jgi:hypothetical protein
MNYMTLGIERDNDTAEEIHRAPIRTATPEQ